MNAGTELESVEQSLIAALVGKDEATLKRLLADGFVGISHTGNLVDKQQYMDVYLNPDQKFAVYETSEVQTRTYGETALLTGEVLIKRQEEADEDVPPKRYLTSYIRENGDWRIASWQDTPIS